MTEQDCIKAISVSVPERYKADAELIAAGHLKRAVLKLGRVDGIEFNREAVTFSLTAGTASYEFGVGILSKFKDVMNIQEIWRTDTPGCPIRVVTNEQFNYNARGQTGSGAPSIATVMPKGKTKTLEFYPTPNSAYPLWANVKMRITNFDEVPEQFHDVLIDMAIASIASSVNPAVAMQMAADGVQAVRNESVIGQSPDTISVDRTFSNMTTTNTDSGNILGG